MPPQNRIALVATLILTSSAGGCSFAFVNGPPPNHRQLPFFGCTSSNTIPTLDVAVAALSAVDAVIIGTGGGANNTTGSIKGDVLSLAASAALLGTSAAYGYKKTAECRDAEAALVRRTPPPPTLAPRPYYPPVPFDPWVPHPAVAPVPPPGAPAPALPTSPGSSSGWDSENPAR